MATRKSARQLSINARKMLKSEVTLEEPLEEPLVDVKTKEEPDIQIEDIEAADPEEEWIEDETLNEEMQEENETMEDEENEAMEQGIEEQEDDPSEVEQVNGMPMESLIKAEPVTEEDARMIECPVCNLNVISFMMEEHKENCAGIDMLDDESQQSFALAESVAHEEDVIIPDSDDVKPLIKREAKYKCEICSKQYIRAADLDRHIKNNDCTDPKLKYECQVCAKTYSRPDNLRAHLRSMHVDNARVLKNTTVQCPECQKELKNKAVLTVHMRTHTGEKPYQCDYCPKAFPTSGAYQKHRRIHTGERPFECPECLRTFTAKEVLNRHLQTHSKVKPHACTYCQKTFVQAMQLRAHMFYHTGEFSYHCSKCDASFHKQSNLALHVKFEHNGAKPLACPTCGKTFLTKNLLSRHLIIHSGRKDFECGTCHKRFVSKPALRTHELTHRREEPRICYDCGRAFIRLDCLIRHMRAKHRDILQGMVTTAETKKIRQHVLSAQANMEKGTNWTDETFTANLRKLLTILIDEHTLCNFGWPNRPIDKILELLIIRCGSAPVVDDRMEYIDRLRENTKLLFTGIINDDALETLLNNNTVDEVVNFVLKLSDEKESGEVEETALST